MKIQPTIYREYDIRGVAGTDLTPEVVRELGKGMGTTFRRADSGLCVVGRDVRLSSPDFHQALVEGLTATGCDVVDAGVVPTPAFYHAARTRGLTAGVMVTGSHNPPEYNGFKVYLGESTIYGAAIQELRKLVDEEDFDEGTGRVESRDVVTPYLDELVARTKLDRPLRVAVDAGNGTAGPIVAPLLERLGCEYELLYGDPDGRFPNHEADPTVEANLAALREKLLEGRFDCGVAYDGDADRIGVLDESGEIIWGDKLLILYARDLLTRIPGAAVIFEVKCSEALPEMIERAGGRPVMWKTGHSLIKKKMKEEGALLAGEMSGHMFFAEGYYGFDDAFYATCRLLTIVAASDRPLSKLLEDVPRYVNTPEIRVECPEEKKAEVVRSVKEEFTGRGRIIDVDGVRVHFDEGWALVRASNTQPVLVLRFEARSAADLDVVRGRMAEVLSAHLDVAPIMA